MNSLTDRYQLTGKIGHGAFGTVLSARDLQKNTEIAIKIEPLSAAEKSLEYEAKIYKYLSMLPQLKGVPKFHFFTQEGNYQVMGLQILGKDLDELFQLCDKKFSLPTVLTIMQQLLHRLEQLHNSNILHRDLKPENICVGLDDQSHKLFLFDFGLAQKFVSKFGEHVKFSENNDWIGTPRFASLNAHKGVQLSRRDDLESLANIGIYFLKGQVAWQNLDCSGINDKIAKIYAKKQNTTIEEMCEGIPREFFQFYTYVRNLGFEEKPDYKAQRELFRNLQKSLGSDNKLDWESVLKLDARLMTPKLKKCKQIPNLHQKNFDEQVSLINVL